MTEDEMAAALRTFVTNVAYGLAVAFGAVIGWAAGSKVLSLL